MADDKSGRDKQADDKRRRQRDRDLASDLERMDEPEPPVDESALELFSDAIEPLSFPATGSEIVEVAGDHEIVTGEDSYTVDELVAAADVEQFESPTAVTVRVKRPTVAATMKRLVEAGKQLPDEQLKSSQWTAYEKTFVALKHVAPDDDDEGIDVIADWILEQIETKRKLPGSRAVRREAAKFCRSNGYTVSNNDWLGI